ncbi:MAG: NAD(+) diphosphatase [Porticoccaceae bacterium]
MEKLAESLGGFYPSTEGNGEPPAFVVLVVDGRIAKPVVSAVAWWTFAELSVCCNPSVRLPLGFLAGVGAGEVWACDSHALQELACQFELLSLRSLLAVIDEKDFGLFSRATQLLLWQRQHRFCGSCGEPTTASAQDHALVCAGCKLTNYPRISPCIITLVHRQDYCLLGRQPSWPPGLFSTLAGFIEPGESAEQALCREVMEESGVRVANLTYFASQAWPFPSQLMLGYFAEYAGGDISVDGIELEQAQWFHYAELPQIPPSTSISGKLIRSFVESRSAQAAT